MGDYATIVGLSFGGMFATEIAIQKSWLLFHFTFQRENEI